MAIKMKEAYYKPIQKDMEYYFYELFWKDILKAIEDPYYLLNSNSALISAIRKGTIHYENGVFSGKYNSRISSELSKFATYDNRSKTWKGIPPSNITAAATVVNDKGRQLNKRIESLISEIPERVSMEIDKLKYSIDAPLFAMSKEASKDLSTIGVTADMTPELSKRLIDNYTNNQNINIKKWSDTQTQRLRDMVKQNVLSGYNRLEMQNLISSEYGVSMNKAKFLARQETSLFMAEVRNERYSDAGLKWYRWSNSGDVRVVGNPAGLYPNPTSGHGNHWVMGGKICKLNDPTVYADNIEAARKGLWKSKASIGADNTHPGQAYNDRCTAIPVIS